MSHSHRRCVVIAVNDAALRAPLSSALFSADTTWICKRWGVVTSFPGAVYLAVSGNWGLSAPNVTWMKRLRSSGLSRRWPEVCTGGNSGHGAINLAFLLGARRIILLGFDCHPNHRHEHWFGRYDWGGQLDDSTTRRWRENFHTLAIELKREGVAVINANPDSAVDAFPRMSLEEVSL